MKNRLTAAIAITGWAAVACIAIAGSENGDVALRAQYAEHIDKIIMNCEHKAGLRNSNSQNLRDSASIYMMKADFITKNRNLLIEDMLNRDIQAKPFKVQYFLNQRFYAIIQEDHPDIVKGYSPPDKSDFSEK